MKDFIIDCLDKKFSKEMLSNFDCATLDGYQSSVDQNFANSFIHSS